MKVVVTVVQKVVLVDMRVDQMVLWVVTRVAVMDSWMVVSKVAVMDDWMVEMSVDGLVVE